VVHFSGLVTVYLLYIDLVLILFVLEKIVNYCILGEFWAMDEVGDEFMDFE
jgi:hypothetical protein